MRNDPFEHIRHIQQIMNNINMPLLEQIQKQYELTRPFMEQTRMIQQNFGPMIEAIQRQQDFMKASISGMKIEDLFYRNSEWISTLEKLSDLHHSLNPIPEGIYPHIEKLLDTIHELAPKESHDDLTALIEVRSPDSSIRQPWTWELFVRFLELLLPLIVTIWLSSVSSEQLERHHEEELQQREQHHLEELSQDELQHLELMEQNQQHHEEILDAFSSLMELIESHLPSDQDTAENDDEDLQPPD